jgi:hypothetical protein
MQVDLDAAEIETLIEGLDCYKTKVSFTKGRTYAEKTEKLKWADAIEQKLRKAEVGSEN